MTTKTPTAAELRAKADAARAALQGALEEADRLATEALQAEYREAQAKRAAEAKEHYDRMYTANGQPLGLNEAQHSIVYSLAWEKWHSYGYDEVTVRYIDLAQVAHRIIAAN